MYYIYVLKSRKDNSVYIGYTENLARRLEEHNAGFSRYTKNKVPWVLLYYESYRSKADAKYREGNLKRFAKAYVQLKKRIKNSLNFD